MIDSQLEAGVIGLALMLVFLFLGAPIFIAIGFSALVGLFLIDGWGGIFLASGQITLIQLGNIGMLALPMFIFMGYLVAEFGIGSDLYDAVYKWLGRINGGLAVASTVVCALFGFVCGSGLAGAATIGRIALPEMERRGYNRRLALGTLALGGSLASLIPPSILMILYSIMADTSIAQVFMAGIIPGIVLTCLMIIYIVGRCTLNPNIGPKGDKYPLKDKTKSLLKLLPAILLFVAVLGGIYRGVWTPMEAGAGGSFIAIVIALAYRRFNWTKTRSSALEAGKTCVMIYLLLISAGLMSTMFYASGLGKSIGMAITGLSLPPWGVILVMLVILTILGCFIDVIGMLLITMPIFYPIILTLGYDPVWFGIIMVVACELGLITPPVGLNLFIIQSIAPKGTTLTDAAIGAAPFVLIVWILFGLLIAFPGIALWLPNTMRG